MRKNVVQFFFLSSYIVLVERRKKCRRKNKIKQTVFSGRFKLDFSFLSILSSIRWTQRNLVSSLSHKSSSSPSRISHHTREANKEESQGRSLITLMGKVRDSTQLPASQLQPFSKSKLVFLPATRRWWWWCRDKQGSPNRHEQDNKQGGKSDNCYLGLKLLHIFLS